MTRRTVVVWLTTVGMLALLGMTRAGTSQNGEIPGAVRTTLADAERDYELRSAALSAGGATTEIIMAARPKGRRSGEESLVWTSVDATGRVLSQQNPLAAAPAAAAARASLRDPEAGRGLAFLRGRAFLPLTAADRGPRLVRLARQNDPAAVSEVKVSGAPNIRRVVAAGDERLLLVGSVGSKPLVTAINAEGKTVADHAPEVEGMTAVGAVSEPDGNVVVAGEQGMLPNVTAWVGRVSARGAVLVKNTFPGRPTDIARGSDGTYVVLIERSGAEGSEILLKALAPDVSELWTRTLASRQRVTIPFRVAPVPTGGYIVAGVKDRGLWVSRVKADGSEVWVSAHDPLKSPELELVSQVELASAQDVFVVAYTAFVVVGREQREVVRTVRFKAN